MRGNVSPVATTETARIAQNFARNCGWHCLPAKALTADNDEGGAS